MLDAQEVRNPGAPGTGMDSPTGADSKLPAATQWTGYFGFGGVHKAAAPLTQAWGKAIVIL